MNAAPLKRYRIRIYGRVQGVYYRATATEKARQLGITGWIRNLPDGSVEAEAQGTPQALKVFVEWCRKGPPLACVTQVEIEELPPATEEETNFVVRY